MSLPTIVSKTIDYSKFVASGILVNTGKETKLEDQQQCYIINNVPNKKEIDVAALTKAATGKFNKDYLVILCLSGSTTKIQNIKNSGKLTYLKVKNDFFVPLSLKIKNSKYIRLIGSHNKNLLRGSNNSSNILHGGDNNDVLRGGIKKDYLSGGKGDDILYGYAGHDTFIGGRGKDRLVGGKGKDTASYASSKEGIKVDLRAQFQKDGDAQGDVLDGIENVIGSNHNDTLLGNNDINILFGGGGNDVLIGKGGNDILIGRKGKDALGGSKGNDKLYGDEGNDILAGNAGDDTLEGGRDKDTLFGGRGSDTASYIRSKSRVTVDLKSVVQKGKGEEEGDIFHSIENVLGSQYSDVIDGDYEANILEGYDGNDTLDGKEGDDTLVGGKGNDNLKGGKGSDTASYMPSALGVEVDLTLHLQKGGNAKGDRLHSIENILGSQYDDTIKGDDKANILEGKNGTDIITGREGDDTLIGGEGKDFLNGGKGDDTASYAASRLGITVNLMALSQKDGNAEGDILHSIEHIIGSQYNDTIKGDGKINILDGHNGNDTLDGKEGSDVLIGGNGDDTLKGGNGDDILISGKGNDILDGGTEYDTAHYALSELRIVIDLEKKFQKGGDAEGDVLYNIECIIGSEYADILTGDYWNNTLEGRDGNDTISGKDGNDVLNGGYGNDTLIGGDGDDRLYALGGDNTFIGGKGNNFIQSGRKGNNLYVFSNKNFNGHNDIYLSSKVTDYNKITFQSQKQNFFTKWDPKKNILRFYFLDKRSEKQKIFYHNTKKVITIHNFSKTKKFFFESKILTLYEIKYKPIYKGAQEEEYKTYLPKGTKEILLPSDCKFIGLYKPNQNKPIQGVSVKKFDTGKYHFREFLSDTLFEKR